MNSVEDYKVWERELILAVKNFDQDSSEIRQFFDFLRTYSKEGKIPNFNSLFIPTTVHNFLHAVLTSQPTDISSRSLIQKLINEVLLHFSTAISNDFFDFATTILQIFNSKAPIYKINNPNLQNSPFLQHITNTYFKSESFNLLLTRINNPDKIPNIMHFSAYLSILCEIRQWFDPVILSNFIGKIANAVDRFYKGVDTTTIRSFDNDILQNNLQLVIFLSAMDDCYKDVTKNTLNFSLQLLQMDILEKQLVGIKVIAYCLKDLHETDEYLLIEWLDESNLMSIFMEKNWHENVIMKFDQIFTTIALVGKVNKDVLHKILSKANNASPNQKKAYFMCIIHCFIMRNREVKDFMDEALKLELTENLFDFMGTIAIQASTQYQAYARLALDFLVQSLPDEKYSKIALPKIVEMLKYKIPNELVQALFDKLAALINPAIDDKIIEIIEKMITSDDEIRVDVTFADKICSLVGQEKRNNERLYNILHYLLVKYKKKLTRQQLETIVKNDDENSCFDFIASSLKLSYECLFPSAYEFLIDLLEKHDFKNASQQFARLVWSFELANEWQHNRVVEANAKSSPTKRVPRYAPVSLSSEFPMTIRIIRECESDESAAFAQHSLEEFSEQSKSSFGVEGFNFILGLFKDTLINGSNNARRRCINVISRLLPKFETDVTLEDIGVTRHTPLFDPDAIKATITLKSESFDMKVSPTVSVGTLLAKIGAKLGVCKDDISLYHEGKLLGRQFTLAQYGIFKSVKFNLITTKRFRKYKFQASSLPSIAICNSGVADIMFDFLNSEDENLINSCLNVLNKIPTAEKALNIATKKGQLDAVINSKTWQMQRYLLESIYESIDFDEYEEEDYEIFCNDYELIRALIDDKIDLKATPPALLILSNLESPYPAKFYEQYFNVASKVFMQEKEGTIAAFQALKNLQEINNNKFASMMFNEKSILRQQIFFFNDGMYKALIRIIHDLDDKTIAFDFLSKIVNEVENHTNVADSFFIAFSESFTQDCDPSNCIDTLKKLLKKAKGTLYVGVVYFLAKVADIRPEIIDEEISQMIIPRIIREQNESVQAQLISIISVTVLTIPSVKQSLLKILGECLSKPSTTFCFTSMEFNYKEEEEGRQMCGLKNLGATCYINSILQQLFSDSLLRQKIIGLRAEKPEWLKDAQHLFASMQLSSNPIQTTTNFCRAMKINPAEQQDAVEFYQSFLGNLPADVTKSFTGKFTHTFEGMNETFTAENHEDFFTICLDVKGYDCLEDSFESFIGYQYLTGGDQYYAEALGHKIDARKSCRISESPEHLFIQLKRFEYNLDTYERYKVNDRFEFPMEIDISRYTSTPSIPNPYKLTGVVIHDGVAELGHYYSLILIDGKWILFNDKNVGEFPVECFESECFGGEDESESSYYSPSAYCLIYTKQDYPHKYSDDDEKITKIVDEEILKQIEADNDTFSRYEATYTEAFLKFILWLNNEDLLLDYFMNVYVHSNLVENKGKVFNSLLKYSDKIIRRFAKDKEHLQNVMLHANEVCIALTCELISSCPNLINEKDNLTKIAEVISTTLKPSMYMNPGVLNIKSKTLQILCRYCVMTRNIIDNVIAAIFSLSHDVESDVIPLLKILMEHVKDLTEHDYSSLICIAPNLLLSVNGTSMMAVFVKAAAENLIDLMGVLRTILASCDDFSAGFLFTSAVPFIPVAVLRDVMHESGITNESLAKVLALTPHRSIVLSQANQLLLDLLIDNDDSTRNNAEKFVKSCFPGKMQYLTAEEILTDNIPRLDDDDFDDDDDDEMIMYEDIDIDKFTEQLVTFINSLDVQQLDCGFRLTSLARTMQRIAMRKQSDPFIACALNLVEKIGQSEPNKLELVRALSMCDQNKMKVLCSEDFIENFVTAVMPISFENVDCGSHIFAATVSVIKKVSEGVDSISVLIMLPDFFEAMVSFIEHASYEISFDFLTYVISNEDLTKSVISIINDNDHVVITSKGTLLTIISKINDDSFEIKKDLVTAAICGGFVALSDSFLSDDSDLQSSFQTKLCQMIIDVSDRFEHDEVPSQFISDVVMKTMSADASLVCIQISRCISGVLSDRSSQYLCNLFDLVKKSTVPIATLCAIFPALAREKNKEQIIECLNCVSEAENHHEPSAPFIKIFLEYFGKNPEYVEELKNILGDV